MLLYNLLTGALAHINKEHQVVAAILNEPNNPELQKTTIFTEMLTQGFIISKTVNELDFIRCRNRKGIFSTRILSITLLPTRDGMVPYCRIIIPVGHQFNLCIKVVDKYRVYH